MNNRQTERINQQHCTAIRECVPIFFQSLWAVDIYPYCELFRYSLLLITLSEAKLTPQSLRDSSPAGEPTDGFVWWLPFVPLAQQRCVEVAAPYKIRLYYWVQAMQLTNRPASAYSYSK